MCSVLVGYPFDLVKVRIQTNSGDSILFVMRQVMRNEGIVGFYRGLAAPLVGVLPIGSFSFWGFDTGKRVVRSWVGKEDLSVGQLCVASLGSAFATTLVITPSDRVKVLMQTQHTTMKYANSWDCARQLYKEGGIQSLYKGTVATLFRDIPGFMAYFVVYELTKGELMRLQGIDPKSQTLSPFSILAAGGLGGVASWTVMMPADTIKSRLQTAPEGTYTGLFDVYQKLMRKEGPAALFKGTRPALIRAFLSNSVCFFGMEVAKEFISFLQGE